MAFVFSSRRRHTRWPRDWSSDVCSSDLGVQVEITPRGARTLLGTPAGALGPAVVDLQELLGRSRSEERRVGIECGGEWATNVEKCIVRGVRDHAKRRHARDKIQRDAM